MIAYGPVPSRRLGKSLGVNNIPPKVCTYSCIYCQLGKTVKMRVKPQSYYRPQRVVDDGQIITEIGVAPSIPGEFIVFRIGRVKERIETIE